MLIKTQTEIEVDINFPYFCEYGTAVYKFTSETKGISACAPPDSNPTLETVIYESVAALVITKGTEIEESKFNEAYNNTLAYFNTLLKS